MRRQQRKVRNKCQVRVAGKTETLQGEWRFLFLSISLFGRPCWGRWPPTSEFGSARDSCQLMERFYLKSCRVPAHGRLTWTEFRAKDLFLSWFSCYSNKKWLIHTGEYDSIQHVFHSQHYSVFVAGTTWSQSCQRCVWRTSLRRPRATCRCSACCPSAPSAGSWSPLSSWTWASSCQGSMRWAVPVVLLVLVLVSDPLINRLTFLEIT